MFITRLPGFRHNTRMADKVMGFFNELHPKTEDQYRTQQALEGIPVIGSWYGNYMRQRAQAEVQKQTMDRLGITWSDIKSPWIAGLTSANVNAQYARGADIVSSNLNRLYK